MVQHGLGKLRMEILDIKLWNARAKEDVMSIQEIVNAFLVSLVLHVKEVSL